MLEDMHASWKAVMHVKGNHHMLAGVACIHKPAEVLNLPDFEMMLTQGILHLVSSGAALDAITQNGTPLYAEIGCLPTHQVSSNSLGSTLSLHLLSLSYKAYMSGLRSHSMLSSCRLSALKLSQQAKYFLSELLADKICFPCQCPDTIAFHLDQLKDTLQRYTAHKCWDIFFQAPWVAGNHILEILDMCFYYGMRLIRYRHYVGSVLHSYNVMKQLAAMEEVPLLEELSNKFASIFFPGGQRPINRFAASWTRFVGARLKFRKGHKGHNHRGSWCMAVPSHAARQAAGLRTGRDGKSRTAEDTGLSELIDLKRTDYHVDESTWRIICGCEDIETTKRNGSRRSKALAKSINSKLNHNHTMPLHSDHLLDLSSYLAQDTNDLLPWLRLNLFAVFEVCVKIVRTISSACHTDLKDNELHCICFATTILRGGDRIRNARALGEVDCWKKSNGERDVVEVAKKAIREIMAAVEAGDWLWNI